MVQKTLKLPATSCQEGTFKDHQEQKLCKPAGRIPIRLKPAHLPRKTAAQIISFLTLRGRCCQKLVSIPFTPRLTKQQITPTASKSSINICKCNIARSFPDLDARPLILPCLEGPGLCPTPHVIPSLAYRFPDTKMRACV